MNENIRKVPNVLKRKIRKGKRESEEMVAQ